MKGEGLRIAERRAGESDGKMRRELGKGSGTEEEHIAIWIAGGPDFLSLLGWRC